MNNITKLYLAVPPHVFDQFMRCHPFPNLSLLMSQAIEDECYEAAAKLRDEITARKNGTPCGHERFRSADPDTTNQDTPTHA